MENHEEETNNSQNNLKQKCSICIRYIDGEEIISCDTCPVESIFLKHSKGELFDH